MIEAGPQYDIPAAHAYRPAMTVTLTLVKSGEYVCYENDQMQWVTKFRATAGTSPTL
jgi:hypothetical protein